MSALTEAILHADIQKLNQDYGHWDSTSIAGGVVAALNHKTVSDKLGVDKLIFASSFGLEDVALQHILMPWMAHIDVVVLDTGRLPEATFDVMERWRAQFGLKIRVERPVRQDVASWVEAHGVDAFYDSVERRLECCQLRKILPLERALAGKRAWFTGLRRGQSMARQEVQVFDLDPAGRLKVSPLAHWSLQDTWYYVKKHRLPYNRLHDEGFPSIGCEPCTRAVLPGEDIRAGRWWWEQESKKECGLHGSSRLTAKHWEAKDAHKS
ncbi:MAG: phosphoadenylyl-sulfate reductase [Deltaproteobacteria bacterium]|nr:phosphoadenylyl-sulfate reductase [Deltaproteobacteria bacterium]